jgi:hypothetical protein
VYVALSRVKSVEGLSLSSPLDAKKVQACREALDFYEALEVAGC